MNETLRTNMAALVPRLRRFAHALCGNPDDGDDLVQTACVKALDRLDQFTPGTRLDSWMFRIVHTSFIDETRRRRRWRTTNDPAALDRISDGGRDLDRVERSLHLARVRAAMTALPENQRAVLALVAIDGRSYKEAAEVLSVPVGTVMSRLARARARLLPLNSEDAA